MAMAIGAVHWGLLPLIVLLAVLHYLFAAISLRAATGHRLPLREMTMAQFSAAAANRLTPAGLGGAAVNIRYLTCRGLPASFALAVVAGVQLLGMLANVLVVALVLLIGHLAGGRTDGLVAALGTGGFRFLSSPRLLLIAAAIGALIFVAVLLIRRFRPVRACATKAACASRAGAVAAAIEILRNPRRVLVVMVTSASTTVTLSIAFAVSVLAVPGAATPGRLGTLVCVYLLGAAAASAIPSPVGSTEAALMVTLGAAHVSADHAVHAILLFQLITYWGPVPIGLATGKVLWRRTPKPQRVPTAPERLAVIAEVEEPA